MVISQQKAELKVRCECDLLLPQENFTCWKEGEQHSKVVGGGGFDI